MATRHEILQFHRAFRGLDLSQNDLAKDPNFASEAKDIRILTNATLSKRAGFKLAVDAIGGYGVFAFESVNPDTGAVTEEILLLGDRLHRVKAGTLTITNAVTQSISVDLRSSTPVTSGGAGGWGTGGWGEEAWGSPVGQGFQLDITRAALTDNRGIQIEDEILFTSSIPDAITAATATVQAVADAINGTSIATAVITGLTTASSATLESVSVVSLDATASTEITFYYTEVVTRQDSAASTALGFAAFKTDPAVPLSDHSVFNRSMYFTTGLDELMVYDGRSFYRAGITGAVPVAATGAAGSLTGTYTYSLRYRFLNNHGTETISDRISTTSTVGPSSEKVNITIPFIASATGFDARAAYTSSLQTVAPSGGLVTISVDNGAGAAHALEVDDLVYYIDTTAGEQKVRLTAVSSTSVTFASTITARVADNQAFSKIALDLFRNETAGLIFYNTGLGVICGPGDAVTNVVVVDDIVDATLIANEEFVPRVRPYTLPPKAKHITTYKNTLVLGNEATNPSVIIHSEPDDPTNFPTLNSQVVEGRSGGNITGIAESNETLVIFKDRSIFTLTGDFFSTATIRVEQLSSGGVGCTSHTSIVDINGVLFFLNDRGIYAMSGASIPELLSRPVNPLITQALSNFNFRRAAAVHHERDQEYILHIPVLETVSSQLVGTTDSLVLVHDYYHNNWVQWTNVNAGAGFAFSGGVIWWAARETAEITGNAITRLYRQNNKGIAADYDDHATPVTFLYASGWASGGNPSIAKKFLRMKIFSIQDDVNQIFFPTSFTINTTTEIDYQLGLQNASFVADFPDRGALWGTRPWGGFVWGNTPDSSFKTKLRSGQARVLRAVFTNSERNTNAVITGWELEVSVPQITTIKR